MCTETSLTVQSTFYQKYISEQPIPHQDALNMNEHENCCSVGFFRNHSLWLSFFGLAALSNRLWLKLNIHFRR
jgi:hypothetical protein